MNDDTLLGAGSTPAGYSIGILLDINIGLLNIAIRCHIRRAFLFAVGRRHCAQYGCYVNLMFPTYH